MAASGARPHPIRQLRRHLTSCAATPPPRRPTRLWIADFTYVPTGQGLLFLSMVVDVFSRRVVGWSMRDDMRAELVIDALSMAVDRRRPGEGLVHHSDRGSQYASVATGRELAASDISASMGSRGDAYDNAAAESFTATIKTELMSGVRFPTRHAARLAIFDHIESFYNRRRRHSALGKKSPLVFEQIHAALTSAQAEVALQKLSTEPGQLQLHGAGQGQTSRVTGNRRQTARGELGTTVSGSE